MKALVKIGKTLVVCLMLLSMMKATILSAFYEYDRSSFIEMFCVNKSRPKLNCNGKCHLAKMQKEENEKKASDMIKQLQVEIVYFFSINPITLTDTHLSSLIKGATQPFDYCCHYSFIFSARLAKPPQPLSSAGTLHYRA